MLIAKALRPPERHMATMVSSGLNTSLTWSMKSGFISKPYFRLSACHWYLGKATGILTAAFGVAEEDVLLDHAHVEDLDPLRVGLPHLVGFSGGHIQPQAGLLRLRAPGGLNEELLSRQWSFVILLSISYSMMDSSQRRRIA